jgi:hypothetical protein
VSTRAVQLSGPRRQRRAEVDVASPSDVPKLAEPWFLTFNASVEFRIAMSAEDLAKADLESAGKKWG